MNGRLKTSLLPWSIAVVLAAVLAVLSVQKTGAAVGDLRDGRTGRIFFDSGDALAGGLVDGRPIAPSKVDGTLTLPENCAPPYRAVILLHGSLGVSRVQSFYANLLLRECYAVFAVDSFAGRGVTSTAENQLSVTTESMTVDAYAALNLLQSHPKIDGKRIAVVGWSKGGGAADHAMWSLAAQKFAPGGARFAAYVAFYPWCGEQIYAGRKMNGPILYLLANQDDWVSGQACAAYAERLTQLKVDLEVRSFDAPHGFDNPDISNLYFPDALVVARCNYEPRADGFRTVETDIVRPWAEFDRYFGTCSTLGAHIGTDSGAAKVAQRALLDFLKNTLGGGR